MTNPLEELLRGVATTNKTVKETPAINEEPPIELRLRKFYNAFSQSISRSNLRRLRKNLPKVMELKKEYSRLNGSNGKGEINFIDNLIRMMEHTYNYRERKNELTEHLSSTTTYIREQEPEVKRILNLEVSSNSIREAVSFSNKYYTSLDRFIKDLNSYEAQWQDYPSEIKRIKRVKSQIIPKISMLKEHFRDLDCTNKRNVDRLEIKTRSWYLIEKNRERDKENLKDGELISRELKKLNMINL